MEMETETDRQTDAEGCTGAALVTLEPTFAGAIYRNRVRAYQIQYRHPHGFAAVVSSSSSVAARTGGGGGSMLGRAS